MPLPDQPLFHDSWAQPSGTPPLPVVIIEIAFSAQFLLRYPRDTQERLAAIDIESALKQPDVERWATYAGGVSCFLVCLGRLSASRWGHSPKSKVTKTVIFTNCTAPEKDSSMNRWLLIGSLTGLMVLSTGCLHHNTRGGCQTCGTQGGMACGGQCSTGQCGDAGCNSCGNNSGLFGKAYGKVAGCYTGNQSACNGECNNGCNAGCNTCGNGGCPNCPGGRLGCTAGPLGWQQGGLDYSSHLNPGFLGHHAGSAAAAQPFTPGPPSAQVAYPYYTHRGPRDFLMANPPSIGP